MARDDDSLSCTNLKHERQHVIKMTLFVKPVTTRCAMNTVGFVHRRLACTHLIVGSTCLIATFRVARLTLQTRKLWSRPTVTLVTLACVSFYFVLFFFLACVSSHFIFLFFSFCQQKNQKITMKNLKNEKKKKSFQVVPPETAHYF